MIGFRIEKRTRRVDARLVGRFLGLPVANVSDAMHRMSAGGARLRPMHGGGRMAGTGAGRAARRGQFERRCCAPGCAGWRFCPPCAAPWPWVAPWPPGAFMREWSMPGMLEWSMPCMFE